MKYLIVLSLFFSSLGFSQQSNLKSLNVSFNVGRYPVCLILSIVQRLFQVLKSTAVGIHPIKATINIILPLDVRLGASKPSEVPLGPFTKAKKNASSVDKSKTLPIIFTNESKMLYLPKINIPVQIVNNPNVAAVPYSVKPNRF